MSVALLLREAFQSCPSSTTCSLRGPLRTQQFLKKYLFIWQRERLQVGREAGREKEGEAGSPLSGEPDVGLDPRALRSWPEPKAET